MVNADGDVETAIIGAVPKEVSKQLITERMDRSSVGCVGVVTCLMK